MEPSGSSGELGRAKFLAKPPVRSTSPVGYDPQNQKRENAVPGDSYVVPFWLWPAFLLGIITYYPKRKYIGASR